MMNMVLRNVALTGLVLSTVACGGGDDDDDKNNAPTCPTGPNATTAELTGVAPAFGASVANSMITHTFQTVGIDAYAQEFQFVPLASHTAGSVPSTTKITILPIPRTDGSGNDFQYSFVITWPTAPAHVAIANAGQYVNPKDGCKFQLPTPLFEYDITP